MQNNLLQSPLRACALEVFAALPDDLPPAIDRTFPADCPHDFLVLTARPDLTPELGANATAGRWGQNSSI